MSPSIYALSGGSSSSPTSSTLFLVQIFCTTLDSWLTCGTALSINRLLPQVSHALGRTQITSEFPALTQACAADRPIKHDIVNHIETTGPPISARSRRLAPERLRIAREEFNHMLELGIICPSSSSWSSALHMVPKHTPGNWRP